MYFVRSKQLKKLVYSYRIPWAAVFYVFIFIPRTKAICVPGNFDILYAFYAVSIFPTILFW